MQLLQSMRLRRPHGGIAGRQHPKRRIDRRGLGGHERLEKINREWKLLIGDLRHEASVKGGPGSAHKERASIFAEATMRSAGARRDGGGKGSK